MGSRRSVSLHLGLVLTNFLAGHFYPVQISQFGLSHYSKNLTLGRPRVIILEDGNLYQDEWHWVNHADLDSRVESVGEKSHPENKVLAIEGRAVFELKKRKNNDLSLRIKVRPERNFTFCVVLRSNDLKKDFQVFYTNSAEEMVTSGTSIMYGYGSGSNWITLNREILVDLQKAHSLISKKLGLKLKNVRLTRFNFHGQRNGR